MSNSSSVDKLLDIFSNEVGAVFRYFINSRYLKSLGLYKMSEKLSAAASDEMGHVDCLIERIISLGGAKFSMPKMEIGSTSSAEEVKKMLIEDLEIENSSAELLTSYIADLEREGDFASSGILRDILDSEIEHINWISEQLSLIDLVGLPNYLSKSC